MKTVLTLGSIAFACLSSSACTFVKSGSTSPATPATGITYYLPKRYFEITIDQKVVPSLNADELAKALHASSTALAAANKEAAEAATDYKRLVDIAKKSAGLLHEADAKKAADVARTKSENLAGTANAKLEEFNAARDAYLWALKYQGINSIDKVIESYDWTLGDLKREIAELEAQQSRMNQQRVPQDQRGAEAQFRAQEELRAVLGQRIENKEKLEQLIGTLHQARSQAGNAGGNPDCTYRTSLSVKPQALTPDLPYRFAAQLDHSRFRSDELTLTTTNSGLLSGAAGKAEDKTAEIILSVVNTIAARSAAGFQILGQSDSGVTIDRNVGIPCENRQVTFITDFQDFSVVSGRLQKDFPNMEVRLTLNTVKGEPQPDATTALATFCNDASRCKVVTANKNKSSFMRGLAYRRDLTHILSLEPHDSGNAIAQTTITLPNLSPTEFLPMPTGAFTNVSYTVAFDNGMLTSYAATRPSEALGFVKIPYDIVVALVKVPAEIFSLRVNLSTQKGALATKELELLQALDKLQEARDAQAAGTGTEPAPADPAPTP